MHDRLANHPVSIDLPGDLPAVRVDAPLVIQVFANLLDNCVRHTPPGTRISISANSEDDAVRVLVDDNGPGLPPGDPERLFKKFQRGREESDSGGAGLGLAICRAIIDAHGGTITASQRPGGGTRFAFTLPIAESGT
jgi:two-component system sensor histidine kinase KdpD